MLDDVLLVVSELVTNAVRHGRGEVALQVAWDDGLVSGQVSDDGAGVDAGVRARPSGRVGGHGLLVVDQGADDWGVRAGSAHVWFEISTQ